MTLLTLLCALVGLSPARAAVVDRIAAVVNDEVVTLSEVYDLGREFIAQRTKATPGDAKVRRAAELEVLDSIVRRRLVAQEMKRLQLEVTPVEVDRAIDDVARRHGLDRTKLQAEVERSGVTWGKYREEIQDALRDQKFTQAIIRPRIAENEDAIRDAFRRMSEGADAPQVVELGAIFLGFPPGANAAAKKAVVAKAKAARARVVKGESFKVVSAAVDQGPYGANGGSMGTYKQGELVDILDKPAFAVPIGQVSEPILTEQGVFLLQVRSRKKAQLRKYEDVRDEIAAKVYQGHIAREKDTWYQQARRAAAVEIKLETQ